MAGNRKQKRFDVIDGIVQSPNTLHRISAKKKQHVHIVPRNETQREYFAKLEDPTKDIVLALGSAGCGKTYLAVQMAIKQLKDGAVEKIIVTRPAVSADEDLGFLPGTIEEKMAPWTRPVFDVLLEYFTSVEIETMMREGVIEIAPLAYMRGRTLTNAFIVADEGQLLTVNQAKMLLSRIGKGSKMVITGDLRQADRGDDNGLIDFCHRIKDKPLKHIDMVVFDVKDVERHPAVKEILRLYGEE